MAVGIDNVVGNDELLIFSLGLAVAHLSVLIEGKENLLLLVEGYVGILRRFQCLEDKSQEECHNYYENGRINYCV